jgi:hypothetical protein
MQQQNQTPMTRIELLFEELVAHYGDGDDPELRVAAKMLMVALDRFRRHGGGEWSGLVREYTSIAVNEQERFERILGANRSERDDGERGDRPRLN